MSMKIFSPWATPQSTPTLCSNALTRRIQVRIKMEGTQRSVRTQLVKSLKLLGNQTGGFKALQCIVWWSLHTTYCINQRNIQRKLLLGIVFFCDNGGHNEVLVSCSKVTFTHHTFRQNRKKKFSALHLLKRFSLHISIFLHFFWMCKCECVRKKHYLFGPGYII